MSTFESTPVKFLKGVGEARAKVLAEELDVRTFRDLLYNFPARYADRSKFYRIAEFEGEMPAVQVRGSFVRFSVEGEGARKRLAGVFTDGRMLMEVVWFAQIERIRESLSVGRDYVLFGRPQPYRGTWSMAHPEIEPFDPARPPEGLRGVYTITEKMRKRMMSTRTLFTLATNLLAHPGFATLGETLPASVVERYSLMPLREALHNLHHPARTDDLRRARERMKFEELFYVELHILRYARERSAKIAGPLFSRVGEYFHDFYSRLLPFELTGAQKRVIREMRADMGTGRQMNRLLHGDVGCGKTMVAFMTMLIALDNGYQAALMAPTEILAQQHFESLRGWAEALGIRIGLLTGSTRARDRREIHEALADGSMHILVGTHALIEDAVQFRRLGLAVIDEQHRFGVAQRARMWRKSAVAPHVLVMTATPIPRTLAMTVYGDLSVSVIDELPPGRKPVETLLRFDESREQVYRLLGRELRAGRQVYIVYPLIHENEKLQLRSVEEGYKAICDAFPSYEVALVHGQLTAAAKDHQMEMFVSGQARIMVATTVIEVGVNVPNATVMVIENAERFGLAQLHQLRGRVGRGADKSYCVLMSHRRISADTRKRLNVMTSTTDGFVVAEADMNLRGPGDMEGTQQSGLAFNLRVANLATDGQIIARAREAAESILDMAPSLAAVGPVAGQPEQIDPADLAILRRELDLRFARSVNWGRIS